MIRLKNNSPTQRAMRRDHALLTDNWHNATDTRPEDAHYAEKLTWLAYSVNTETEEPR